METSSSQGPLDVGATPTPCNGRRMILRGSNGPTFVALIWLLSFGTLGCQHTTPEGQTPSAWRQGPLDATVRPCKPGWAPFPSTFTVNVEVIVGSGLVDGAIARALVAVRTALKMHGGTLRVHPTFRRLEARALHDPSSARADHPFAGLEEVLALPLVDRTPALKLVLLMDLEARVGIDDPKEHPRRLALSRAEASEQLAQMFPDRPVSMAHLSPATPMAVIGLRDVTRHSPTVVGVAGVEALIGALGGPRGGQSPSPRCVAKPSDAFAAFTKRLAL